MIAWYFFMVDYACTFVFGYEMFLGQSWQKKKVKRIGTILEPENHLNFMIKVL